MKRRLLQGLIALSAIIGLNNAGSALADSFEIDVEVTDDPTAASALLHMYSDDHFVSAITLPQLSASNTFTFSAEYGVSYPPVNNIYLELYTTSFGRTDPVSIGDVTVTNKTTNRTVTCAVNAALTQVGRWYEYTCN